MATVDYLICGHVYWKRNKYCFQFICQCHWSRRYIYLYTLSTNTGQTYVRPLQCGHLSNIFKHANVYRKKKCRMWHISQWLREYYFVDVVIETVWVREIESNEIKVVSLRCCYTYINTRLRMVYFTLLICVFVERSNNNKRDWRKRGIQFRYVIQMRCLMNGFRSI